MAERFSIFPCFVVDFGNVQTWDYQDDFLGLLVNILAQSDKSCGHSVNILKCTLHFCVLLPGSNFKTLTFLFTLWIFFYSEVLKLAHATLHEYGNSPFSVMFWESHGVILVIDLGIFQRTY